MDILTIVGKDYRVGRIFNCTVHANFEIDRTIPICLKVRAIR